ncbi:MAG: NAD-dependent epimerase/dehydratase family protein, partial [Sulfolobales archaeon]
SAFSKIVAMDLRPNTKLISDIISEKPDVIEILRGDAAELSDVIEALKICSEKPLAIYALAALLSGDSEASPSRALRVNVVGLHNALEAAKILGVSKVVFTSSIAVYGKAIPRIVSEDIPLIPETFYGASKVFGELWGLNYARKYGVDFRALRLPSVIGPGRPDGGITIYASMSIQKAAQGEPYSIRVSPSAKVPIIYVKDAVKALYEIAWVEAPSRIYNIAGVTPTPTAGDIVAEIKKILPEARIDFKPIPEYDRIISSWPENVDDSKARREWGWKPSYGDLPSLVKDFVHEVRVRKDIFYI